MKGSSSRRELSINLGFPDEYTNGKDLKQRQSILRVVIARH